MRRNGQRFIGVMCLGLLGACGTTESPGETTAAREGRRLVDGCEVRPPFTGHFEPRVQWAWTGSEVLPDHDQVMMTPVVVDVNGDATPDIVFSTFAGKEYGTDGVLRAISGSVTNIHDDGSLPRHPAAWWLQPRLNSFSAPVPTPSR